MRVHAVKVVANLAAEGMFEKKRECQFTLFMCIGKENDGFILTSVESNQQRIVEAGGLTSLLMLLRNFEDETIRRVAAGAIANLAMNGG